LWEENPATWLEIAQDTHIATQTEEKLQSFGTLQTPQPILPYASHTCRFAFTTEDAGLESLVSELPDPDAPSASSSEEEE